MMRKDTVKRFKILSTVGPRTAGGTTWPNKLTDSDKPTKYRCRLKANISL